MVTTGPSPAMKIKLENYGGGHLKHIPARKLIAYKYGYDYTKMKASVIKLVQV